MTVKEYKGESTEELIANKRDKEIAKENPDVILFEPPFITDNGKTGNGNSVANTQKFVQALSTSAKGYNYDSTIKSSLWCEKLSESD